MPPEKRNVQFAILKVSQEHVKLSIHGNVKEVTARGANDCWISLKGLE
ncbi:hypothetical protein MHB78_01500 [Bacillus sp. FSL K6-0138]|nr:MULTISPECIES: hypothetical protein [Bacillus]MDU0072940.1 hypothetical protein [Bacillus sp. IG6]MED8020822.1 hypothetical protein [Bacillus glycinifermentans]WKB79808.1 hypothetical protein QYM22_01125 [Bacillus glycinifermentans]